MTAPEWNEHEIEQIRRWRETAPGERLRWLEEAKRFAAASLPRSTADELDSSVRAKFLELWDAAQGEERE